MRAEGYTLDQIQEALTKEGVHVSRSTVWRESMRPQRPTPSIPAALPADPVQQPAAPAAPPPPSPPPAPPAADAPLPIQQRSGKDVAEEWFGPRHTKRLLFNRTKP